MRLWRFGAVHSPSRCRLCGLRLEDVGPLDASCRRCPHCDSGSMWCGTSMVQFEVETRGATWTEADVPVPPTPDPDETAAVEAVEAVEAEDWSMTVESVVPAEQCRRLVDAWARYHAGEADRSDLTLLIGEGLAVAEAVSQTLFSEGDGEADD